MKITAIKDCCPSIVNVVFVGRSHLSRHMHEQHSSHWSLGLAVTLVRSVDGVSLQYAIQILLTAPANTLY